MFPVRRELVGKRFAYIQGDGRTGTRKRGHHPGLSQNWNELSWVTGTILAANVDGLDTQDDSVVSKKVKLFVHYDSRYQLQKEWIKLYSGSYRIFFIEENLVLCRRKEVVGYSSQSYGWPALRMVPILDRNFMDENPHLIPVEYMGSRKQLSFIAFEDIIKLFPDEDQTLLFQSVQQNSYLKSDYQSWERIQKTQMILLYGPYSLTGCRVEVNDPSTGRCYRGVIISHDCMKRVLDVMDDQLLKSRKVNPKLIQVNFLASDEDIDKLMCGEAPKAMPTRYSRYGHQVQHSRYQLEDLGSNQPFSHFTLPHWMTSINFMGQDHCNQLAHDDFQKNSVPPSTKLNIAMNHCDEGELDTSSVGSVDVSDHGMPISDFQNGIQKEGKRSMHFSPTQRIVSSEEMKKAASAFSPKAIDAPPHSTNRFQGSMGPCHQHSPAVPLSNSNVQHFGSPPSSSHLPVGGLDQHASDRPSSSPFADTRISRYPTSSSLISPKGQCYDAFPSPPTPLHNLEDNSSNPYLQLSCYQSPQRTRDVEKGPSTGLVDLRHSTAIERPFTGLERAASLPKEFEMKVSPKLQSNSSPSPDGRQKHQQEQKNGSQFGRFAVAGSERCFDDTVHHQPIQHQSIQNQSPNIDQGDLACFLNQLDACLSTPVRKPQQPQHAPNYIKSSASANATEHLHTMQKNPNFQKDCFSAYMQQRAAGHCASFQTQDSPTFQEMLEQYLSRQISDKQGLVSQDFAVTPTSYMTRSLSSDNFRVVPEQFPMSPPNGPPKKAKGRGRKKARSKDDTSRPSTEASKNLSSLLLSSRKEKDMDGIVEGLGKEAGSEDSKFSKTRKEAKASSKELVSENEGQKNNRSADIEKKVPVKERDDSIANKDMTARVALAFAGFSHGCNIEHRGQDVAQNIAEQKIPTGATWIENFRTELSGVEIANAKPKLNVICAKKALASAHFESIDRPPSPEFLPKRDRGADDLEPSKSDLLEDTLSNVGDKNRRFVSSVNESLQNDAGSYGEKKSTELVNVSEVEQAKLNDAVDAVSSSTDSVLGEHKLKNDAEQQESRSENDVAECIGQLPSIGIKCVNKEDEVRASTGLPKVLIASLPVVSLGFHADSVSVASKGQCSNAEKVVRNIYGRALYQRTQTGPNFSQQLRTDKIVGSVSSCEVKGALKPSSGPCFENHGLKPSSELSNENHELRPLSGACRESHGLKPSSELSNESRELRPLSGASHENHGLKPSSELGNRSDELRPLSGASHESDGLKRSLEHSRESHELKSSSGPSQDIECATSEKICKILCSNSPGSTSELREMLQAEKSRFDVLLKAPAISAAQPSTKHMSPCFSKKEPGPKFISDKKVKVGESRTQKNNCKHKRKPCVCELKMTVANLASKAPLSCKLSSTFQSLQRLANENPVSPQLLVISQSPQLPSGNTSSQVDLEHSERISLLGEPSFRILERKEIVEEPENQSSQQPDNKQTNTLHEETVVSNQTDAMTLGPNSLDFGSSLRYSKKSEPRSSQKCKHKRRPCRCDVEAAKELSAHIEFLKSSALNELENSSTETVLSNLEHSVSQASDSPRVNTYSSSSSNAMGYAYLLNSTNESTDVGEQSSVGVENVDGNQNVSVLNEPLSAPEEIHNMLWNLGNSKEQSLLSSSCLLSTSTTGEGFAEELLRSVASSDEKIEGKISDFMVMNEECQKEIIAKEKKVKPVRKCKHKKKPCKCDNTSICSIEMKGYETRTVLSGDREKTLSTDSFEVKETEDMQRKSLHDSDAKKDDVGNKFVESSEFGKKTLIAITSKNQTGVRHVIQSSDLATRKVQEDAKKLKVLSSNAFPSSSTKNLPSDGFSGKEGQEKIDGMDPGTLEGCNRPSENIQSNQGQCTSSAFASISEEGSSSKDKSMYVDELNVSDPLISSGTASSQNSVTGQPSRHSGSDVAVTNIEVKEDVSSRTLNLERNNNKSSSLVETFGSNEFANVLHLNSTNLMEKSQSDSNEEKDAKCLLPKETTFCYEEDKIDKEKLETINDIGNSSKCVPVFDGQDSLDRKSHVEVGESDQISIPEKFKSITQERREAIAQYDGCNREQGSDTDVSEEREEQSIKNGILMGKEMKTFDNQRQPERGCLPTSNESQNSSKLSTFPFAAQSKSTTSGELKLVTASNSLKITVPPNLNLPSNILDVPGGRFTARAKIACPEKDLEPLKGGPVNVSFDGGKTYTFANIVEIRNKQNIAVDGEKSVAESRQISEQRKESEKEAEIPTAIDAVLLAYSPSGEAAKGPSGVAAKGPSGVAAKDLTRKEGNASEKTPHSTTNVNGIPEAHGNTDNSSVEDVAESDVIEDKKESLDSLKSENKLIGPLKELRRSSRFSVKNSCDNPKEEIAEFQNKKSNCAESTMACVLPDNGRNEKSLTDSSSFKTEDGKERVRKVKPISINLESQLSACEKRKKVLQTSKDEMFDSCAIHKNLFCKKCLPFKVNEGDWPVSSRAKEINSAWRTFVRKCAKHDCSRCTDCSEISYEAFQTRALVTADNKQTMKCYLTVRNEEVVAQKRSEENALGAQKVDNGSDHIISSSAPSIMQLSVDSAIENEVEKIQVASTVDDIEAQFEAKCEEKKTAFRESLDKKSRKERKSKTVKYEKKLAKETDVSVDEIRSAETSWGDTTVLMADSIGGGKSKTERDDSNDRMNIASSKSQSVSSKETQDEVKQEPKSDGEQNSRRKLKQDRIKVEKDDKSSKVEGNSTDEKGRKKVLEKRPESSLNQRCQVQLAEQDSCQTSNVPTLHEESATIQNADEQSSDTGDSQCTPSSKTYLPRKRKALEAAENKLLEMRTDEKSKDSSEPSGKCLIHGRKTCGACKPFYENEGEWPGWARRGEVRYVWESKSDDRRSFHTVKCRIHLKAKCPKCEPFKDKDGFWPSWLERHAIEDHYSKFRQGNMTATDADGNFSKENVCQLHNRYYCLRCYELKFMTGKWPNDDQLVEKAEKRRQHEKARCLASWNSCEIHEERICLPCFYFWKKEGRAPYSGDKKAVKRLWKSVASQISSLVCNVHKKRFCKSCTPIFLSEEKFPGRENHLKSIYSWELFKDLLVQYSPEKITNREKRNVKESNSKGRSLNDFKRSEECIILLEKIIKSNKKSLDKFHCTLHELFPCFACMPKFVKDSCWPNESDYDEMWQHWTSEHPDEESCVEHGHLFCTECNGIQFLFDKFKKPGVTDIFLDLVTKCSGEVEVPKRRYKKRKLDKSDGDYGVVDLHYSQRDEKISVSSKGRIRSKVMRPGTVDISKLEEVFVEKKTGKSLEIVDGGHAQSEKVKSWTKVNKRLKEQPAVAVNAEPVKRKRGRPRKKPLEPEEPAPKKRRGRKPKFGLVEQVRSGSLKIINVDDLRDQLEAEHERDPSPSHIEYVQLLDTAERMNVKYFAISADSDNVINKDKKIKEKSKMAVPENMNKFDDRKNEKDRPRKSVEEENCMEKKQGRKGAVSLKEVKAPAKLSAMPMWSENDIELILQKVEKAALAAKAKREEALHRKKQRQGKKPLTVAQVLAIKRKRAGDTRPVMDERAREDLENMLKEAERRSVDLDTLLEEAIKTKDKEERRKQIAKQKAMEKVETFLQDKPCDQTPKLPKCRDCRIADKRNADQNAFCRFVMFRRLFKRPKTGKIESAGFCSPASADQNAFIPWSSISSEVDIKASVCRYIVKNIAGQFCAVVEEECLALMLGTKNGAVAWKRAVAGVREMCDACATTVFNIHWVCEKCGFGVCPDCFRSKVSENELKGEGYRAFEFNWSACAPGLSHKPTNLTVTQIIPQNALWDLCLQTVDICESLGIPFKLSENVLKKSMPLHHERSNCRENGKAGATSERVAGEEQDSIIEHNSSSEISQGQKVCDQNAEGPCFKGLQPPSISIAPLTYSTAGPVQVETPNKCTALGNGVEVKLETGEDIAVTATNAIGRSVELLAGKEETKKIQSPENKVFDSLHSSNSVLGTNSLQFNSTGLPLGKLHHCSHTNLESAVSGKPLDGEDLYYRNVCETSLSVLDKIKKWKDSSKMIIDERDVNVGDGCAELSINDEKETEMMAAVNFGNDSLLSDVSMTSDDAELVASPVKADLDNEANNLLTADNSAGKIAPQGVSTVNDAQDSSIIVSPNRHFSPQFQNSLDILAMVASGFGISSNNDIAKCAEEEIARSSSSSEKQTSPVADDRSKGKSDSVSGIDGPALIVEESMFFGNQHSIASYLCDGQLLQLNYSKHPKNIELFRRVWRKGFPLLVSGVTDVLNNQLWKPESFAADFGDEHADVVNCLTGDILHQFSVGEFWKGFESIKDRRTNSDGMPMLLKLKDWPPGADFLEKMPKRFDDLMNAIPLPEYTRRDGQLNLVSRLPTNHFIKPDLGPKMYNAYGSAAAPSAGTTNLHLDMSDAVNVMVYVGVPRDPLLGEQEIKDALITVDMACCEKTKHRVRQPNVLPGALWHIYAAEDADKIRMFLRKVAEERKLKYSVYNDPIHDQSFYLDYDMRKRLKAEYGVTGFAICQCLGDAVFIPAGAPHQVLNLHSCVKVAEDFVSPERIGQCFNLTQEFRYLSDRHTNHEDKLQIKNIIYHAVKDSVAVLKES